MGRYGNGADANRDAVCDERQVLAGNFVKRLLLRWNHQPFIDAWWVVTKNANDTSNKWKHFCSQQYMRYHTTWHLAIPDLGITDCLVSLPTCRLEFRYRLALKSTTWSITG